MAEFGTFSLKDAIAPALQVQQMQLQQAETQGVLAKLAREREMRDRRQQTLSAIGPDSDLDALDTAQRDLLKAGDTEGAAEVGKLSDAAFKRQFERQKQQDDVALKWMGVIQKSPEILKNPEFRKYLAGPGGIGQSWAAELTPDNLKDADDALKRRKLIAETLVAERAAKLGPDAKTDLGKLNQDLANGNISLADYNAKRAEVFGPDSENLFTNASKLRGEFEKQSAEFVTVRDAYKTVLASAEDPSAAGDLSLIFAYMKMLDPGSAVKEGEYATAEKAAGVPEQIRSTYNRVFNGEKLGESQRRDFVDRAQRLYDTRLVDQDERSVRYSGLAETYGIPPEQVVRDMRVSRAPAAAASAGPVADKRDPANPATATAEQRENRFLGMKVNDLLGIDISALKGAEMDAYIEALEAAQKATANGG